MFKNEYTNIRVVCIRGPYLDLYPLLRHPHMYFICLISTFMPMNRIVHSLTSEEIFNRDFRKNLPSKPNNKKNNIPKLNHIQKLTSVSTYDLYINI